MPHSSPLCCIFARNHMTRHGACSGYAFVNLRKKSCVILTAIARSDHAATFQMNVYVTGSFKTSRTNRHSLSGQAFARNALYPPKKIHNKTI